MKVVISLHGIRTRGTWQKELAPYLAKSGFIPVALDYGSMSAVALMNPSSLDRHTDHLVREYDRICRVFGDSRPSVICHSFGTLLVAHLLRKYEHVVFDKVILAASIIPTDFDFAGLLAQRRVNWVESYFGGRDVWPRVAAAVVPWAGSSGFDGFEQQNIALHEVRVPFAKHSDFFSAGNFEKCFIPTLLADKRSVVSAMEYVLSTVAKANKISHEKLRAFVFMPMPDGRHLAIVPGLAMGSLAPGEDKVTIDMTGWSEGPAKALRSGLVHVVEAQDSYALRRSPSESVQIMKGLAWTASAPFPNPDTGEFMGVLVIDGQSFPGRGLDKTPTMPENLPDVLELIGSSLSTLA